MPVYRISRESKLVGGVTRHRADAAQALLERIVYQAIATHAGLDTAWGHRAMAAAKSANVRKGGEITTSHFTIYFSCMPS